MDIRGRTRSSSAMKGAWTWRLILVPALLLANDHGPLPNRIQLFALAVEGSFDAQKIQAARCNVALKAAGQPNTPSRSDMYWAIMWRVGPAINRWAQVRNAYYINEYREVWTKLLTESRIELLKRMNGAAHTDVATRRAMRSSRAQSDGQAERKGNDGVASLFTLRAACV